VLSLHNQTTVPRLLSNSMIYQEILNRMLGFSQRVVGWALQWRNWNRVQGGGLLADHGGSPVCWDSNELRLECQGGNGAGSSDQKDQDCQLKLRELG
jgi:hypothetical protein